MINLENEEYSKVVAITTCITPSNPTTPRLNTRSFLKNESLATIIEWAMSCGLVLKLELSVDEQSILS